MAVHVLGTMPPITQVGISVSSSYLSRGLGGQPVARTALLDSGASMTAIDPRVITALQPLQLGAVEVARPHGATVWVPTYDVCLAFEPDLQQGQWSQHGRWFNVEVIVATPASVGVDVLVGQDLLRQVVLSWDGPRGRLLLMY